MRRVTMRLALAAACVLMLAAGFLRAEGGQNGNPGWNLPPTAAAEKNPLTVNPAVLAAGRKFFVSKCQRCHGPEGAGDGPDADSNFAERMDLRKVSRAADNPDGVVFHKIWTGRVKPKMPPFADELSREQAWAIVAYVQTLRTMK
jgi:mono/diheme cytochrome c family protein